MYTYVRSFEIRVMGVEKKWCLVFSAGVGQPVSFLSLFSLSWDIWSAVCLYRLTQLEVFLSTCTQSAPGHVAETYQWGHHLGELNPTFLLTKCARVQRHVKWSVLDLTRVCFVMFTWTSSIHHHLFIPAKSIHHAGLDWKTNRTRFPSLPFTTSGHLSASLAFSSI